IRQSVKHAGEEIRAICNIDGLLNKLKSCCARATVLDATLALRTMEAAAFGSNFSVRSSKGDIKLAGVDGNRHGCRCGSRSVRVALLSTGATAGIEVELLRLPRLSV